MIKNQQGASKPLRFAAPCCIILLEVYFEFRDIDYIQNV